MGNKQVISPIGQSFTINDEGRKIDEDGFMCAMGTPGLRNPWWFCVSVKRDVNGAKVRDTKDPSKTTLSFTKEEWKAFISGVKNGEFDID